MLFSKKLPDGRKRYTNNPLLIKAKDAYRPPVLDFTTSTTIWLINGLIKRRIRDWRRLMDEDGHTNSRNVVRDDTVYTGTFSVFPMPLAEMILMRYAGERGGRVLDPFAGGPPRAVACALLGYEYHGIEIRQEQIDENFGVLKRLGLNGTHYYLDDGRYIKAPKGDFDFCYTCPPYWNVEVYSAQANDLSNCSDYRTFDEAMKMSAQAQFVRLKPGKFAAIVVGNFRDKKGEIIDLRSDTVANYRAAGFVFHDEVILQKNMGSAAKRAANSWKGLKLVRIHEFLLIFKKPFNVDDGKKRITKQTGKPRVRLKDPCNSDVSSLLTNGKRQKSLTKG